MLKNIFILFCICFAFSTTSAGELDTNSLVGEAAQCLEESKISPEAGIVIDSRGLQGAPSIKSLLNDIEGENPLGPKWCNCYRGDGLVRDTRCFGFNNCTDCCDQRYINDSGV